MGPATAEVGEGRKEDIPPWPRASRLPAGVPYSTRRRRGPWIQALKGSPQPPKVAKRGEVVKRCKQNTPVLETRGPGGGQGTQSPGGP